MKRIGIVSGSFDPITNGHLWVIEEAKKLFDEVHVLIGPVAKKETLFTPQERKHMIEKVLKPNKESYPLVIEILHTGNILAYVKEISADKYGPRGEICLLRGIRNEADCKYELDIVECIRAAGGQVHYLFVTPPSNMKGLSSSYTKYLCACSHWEEVGKAVPEVVKDELWKAYKERRKTFITAGEVATLYPEVASIFETTTAGFAPTPNATFKNTMDRKEDRELYLLSTSGHQIPMVDELETILDEIGRANVNITFFGKIKDNFKHLVDTGFIKFSDFVTAEQVSNMLDPCWMEVVSSEVYELKEIPLESVKPMGGRYLPASQSLGPIIVDLKPKAVEWSTELPAVVVIEGKHRWLDAQERGDEKIMAYVGNKALKYFKTEK